MAGFYGETYDTVGLEYETTAFDRDWFMENFTSMLQKVMGDRYRNVSVTRDASIEFKAVRGSIGHRNLLVSKHTQASDKLNGLYRSENKIMGAEVVTLPMEIPELEATLYPMFSVLRGMGDFTSNRASTHYHVGFPNNLRILKNWLAIALNLEPVLFRLGGMGRKHRSFCNQATYCRPLLYPAVVPLSPMQKLNLPEIPTNPKTLEEFKAIKAALAEKKKAMAEAGSKGNLTYVKISNPLAALEADNLTTFWASFGIHHTTGSPPKYHPVRYSGVNFFAIAQHGTMEIRHANQSMDAPLVIAVGKFVRASVELSSVIGKREVQMFEPVDSKFQIPMGPAVDIINKTMALCREKELENLPNQKELNLIFETLEKSSFEELPSVPVKTHKSEFYLDPLLAARGKLEVVSNPAEPKYIDIHNIDQNPMSIYDEGDQI